MKVKAIVLPFFFPSAVCYFPPLPPNEAKEEIEEMDAERSPLFLFFLPP